jgi:hypothetical protein
MPSKCQGKYGFKCFLPPEVRQNPVISALAAARRGRITGKTIGFNRE